jgi:uncharacterized membrane protein SpoIIM required for sporulation
MTPLRFEQLYEQEWAELALQLDMLAGRRSPGSTEREPASSARTAMLYRRACEHLALARSRSYPAYLIDRLEQITAEGHQRIYYKPEWGAARLRHLVAVEFPRAVRQQWAHVATAAAVFLVPAIVLGIIVSLRPEFILSVVTADRAAEFEQMYGRGAESIGRTRDAATDWMMFGYYIRNNVGVAFQCFAGGMFAGIGSLFFLAYNGAFSGAIAGYLTSRGLGDVFYPFIATHSAFELTSIVIAGAAGLRLGHSLVAPGRSTRTQSLVAAGRECAPVIYGVIGMLLIAAALEAFWSSAGWLDLRLKLAVAALCWTAVIAYLTLQGRSRAD